MTAEVVREVIADNMMEGYEPKNCVSSRTFTKEHLDEKFQSGQVASPQPSSSSAYILAEDSLLSREIENWISGNHQVTPGTPAENGGQGNATRPMLVQRSVLARSSSIQRNGFWYILAMLLPLFSFNPGAHWRCTPSLVLNTAELLMSRVSRVCGRARAQLGHLSQDQVARQLFATAMDVILVIYAIGFLVLSMYQASIFV